MEDSPASGHHSQSHLKIIDNYLYVISLISVTV